MDLGPILNITTGAVLLLRLVTESKWAWCMDRNGPCTMFSGCFRPTLHWSDCRTCCFLGQRTKPGAWRAHRTGSFRGRLFRILVRGPTHCEDIFATVGLAVSFETWGHPASPAPKAEVASRLRGWPLRGGCASSHAAAVEMGWTPLHTACRDGDMKRLNRCVTGIKWLVLPPLLSTLGHHHNVYLRVRYRLCPATAT